MKKVSIVIPLFNESTAIAATHAALTRALDAAYEHEIIFVNDGSTDDSAIHLAALAAADPRVRVIEFSRNFGKEIALTAGLHHATGDAALMMDADLQHPPEHIAEFLKLWESGNEVVVGVRKDNRGHTLVKRIGSRLFYNIMNAIADTKIVANATDFRLLDRSVIDIFNRFTEKDRLTRGLIDWVGFRRAFVYFEAPSRVSGRAAYSFYKLVKLAFSSFVSMSLFPLRLAGYLGVITVIGAGGFGLFIVLAKYVVKNQWALSFSGAAELAILLVFLVGMVLCCLGLIALYIATIHKEVLNRPLYIVRTKYPRV